jgi:hypothetical protein
MDATLEQLVPSPANGSRWPDNVQRLLASLGGPLPM